jgi:Sigma-70, region 4
MTTRPLPAGNFTHLAGIPMTRPRIGISGSVVTKSWSSKSDEALVKLYDDHGRSLLGLAALLAWGAARASAPAITEGVATGESFPEYAHDSEGRTGEFSTIRLLMASDAAPGVAEQIVEDAFAAMRLQWRRLRSPDRCLAFLRRFVVDATRCLEGRPAAGRGGLPALGGRTLAVLRQLPGRQREALVLRYYADLPEGQAAAAMGVTRAAFRWHVTRGMAALRLRLNAHGLDAHGVAGLSTTQCTVVHR